MVGGFQISINGSRRAKTALAREKRSGLTLEFSPHDSTLLQIEGVGNKITRITKMVIVIEEKISETKDYALHKGTRDSSPVCVYVVKLSEATYEAAKTAIVARDQASDSCWSIIGDDTLCSLRVLTKTRVGTGGVQGNQIHSGVIWTLRIPKM